MVRLRNEAEEQGGVWSIRLASGWGKGKGVLLRLASRFGDDLQGLVEQTGAAYVEMNPSRHVMSVIGTVDAFNAVSYQCMCCRHFNRITSWFVFKGQSHSG